MRINRIAVAGVVVLCGLCDGSVLSAQAGRGGSATPSPVAAPTDKAAYFSATDTQKAWRDEEARQVANTRILEGGSHSINIRIVRSQDPPLVHALSGDTWVVMEGTAIAVTGGELLDIKRNPNSDDTSGSAIKGGVEQPLKAGDVLFVPPGVPHGFKDMKGFRAFLIRYPTK